MAHIFRIKQFVVAAGDGLALMGGLWLALFLRQQSFPSPSLWIGHMGLFSIVFLGWLLVHYMIGLYDLYKVAHRKILWQRLSRASIIAFLTGTSFFYLVPTPVITPKTILLLTVLAGYGLIAFWRLTYSKISKGTKFVERILFIGHNKEIQELLAYIRTHQLPEYDIVGIVTTKNDPLATKEHAFASLSEALKKHAQSPIHTVVVASHCKDDEKLISEIYALLFASVHVVDHASFYETITGRVPPGVFSDSWFMENLTTSNNPAYSKWKKIIDISAGISIGAVFLLLLPFISAAIKLSSKGPVFFSQERVGLDGRTFRIHKFRSMYALAPDGSAEKDGVQFATKKDARITSVGKILRKTRLDELPQVWNLLNGDVTLIGPRPERPELVKTLTNIMPYYALRHVVKPGLTGWAVVNQNYADTIEKSLQKLQYDLYYIKHKSIIVDVEIVWRTLKLLLGAKGQ